MRIIFAFAISCLYCLSVYAADTNPSAYKNNDVGIYIEKPVGWYFISKQVAVDNRSKIRLKDEEFQQKYFNTARAPLVVMNKYEHPELREGISPTVQVLMTPSPNPNMTPEQVLGMSIQAFRSNATSFKYIEDITPYQISGVDGAKAVFVYSLATTLGYEINVKTRTYVAKRGGYFFVVSMAAPPSGEDASNNEFSQVIKSLKIEK